jgi:hypothetical protein
MTRPPHDLHPEGVIDEVIFGTDTLLTLDNVVIAKREGDRWQPFPGYTIREAGGGHLIITYPVGRAVL